jgi:hypothetical protein
LHPVGKLQEPRDAETRNLAANQQTCIGLMNLEHLGNLSLG